MAIFALKAHLDEKIWGGLRLAKMKNLDIQKKIGESLEISTLKSSQSLYQEKELASVLGFELPFLVKFIDTSDLLSLQVHPGDGQHGQKNGKTECWVVLDAGTDSQIYLGLKEGISKEEFKRCIDQHPDQVNKLLQSFNVKKGDFYFVPAGTFHAIGRNLLIAEIQQTSGVTYRVWDWGRLGDDGKPRPLHLNQAMDVGNFELKANHRDSFHIRHNIFEKSENQKLIDHKDFKLEVICGKGSVSAKNANKVVGILALRNNVQIKTSNENLNLKPFSSALTVGEELIEIQVEKDGYCLCVTY